MQTPCVTSQVVTHSQDGSLANVTAPKTPELHTAPTWESQHLRCGRGIAVSEGCPRGQEQGAEAATGSGKDVIVTAL